MMENFKLRVFRVVADTLNFRRAADELHLTQPEITAQIKTLLLNGPEPRGPVAQLLDLLGRYMPKHSLVTETKSSRDSHQPVLAWSADARKQEDRF
jgi:hypothetical protein